MRMLIAALVAAGLLAVAPVRAQDVRNAAAGAADAQKACETPADLLNPGDSVLTKVASSVKNNRKLDILVVGSGSSTLAGPGGASIAYPARLEATLRQKLPGITVTIAIELHPKRTAEEVAETLKAIATERKPDLLIWQTGTVDAIRSTHPDDFRNALDDGVGTVKATGVDAMLMNLQYSPRMEAMLPMSTYLDNLRAVAQQQDVPLFDRYSIMQNWNETGEFDLSNSSRSFALAKGVHDCIGRVLADFVIAAAKIDPSEFKAQR